MKHAEFIHLKAGDVIVNGKEERVFLRMSGSMVVTSNATDEFDIHEEELLKYWEVEK